jgi:mRNA interferase MazF
MVPKRYDIYLANLDPTVGSEISKTRPIVIVSDNMLNRYLETVVACPLTTSLHTSWRSRVETACDGKPAEIAVDQIRAISKRRLIRRLDRISSDAAADLRRVITEMYGE